MIQVISAFRRRKLTLKLAWISSFFINILVSVDQEFLINFQFQESKTKFSYLKIQLNYFRITRAHFWFQIFIEQKSWFSDSVHRASSNPLSTKEQIFQLQSKFPPPFFNDFKNVIVHFPNHTFYLPLSRVSPVNQVQNNLWIQLIWKSAVFQNFRTFAQFRAYFSSRISLVNKKHVRACQEARIKNASQWNKTTMSKNQ